ncbi:MAG: PEP-CTERM sorting domain-containing protein, partial [Verrucomicrobiaceae bacterium]
STSFSLSSTYGQLPVFLENRGPNVGATDLLVFKLSIAPNQSKVEFFLNPSLDSLPTVATLTLPVSDDITMGQAGGFQVITASNRTSGPTWSLDEIRVGQTYAQVIPEPSCLLLTGLGVALFGGARLRRSRVSLS